MRKLKLVNFHTPIEIPGVGNLGKTLPNQNGGAVRFEKLDLYQEGDKVLIDVVTNRRKVDGSYGVSSGVVLVPLTNVVSALYAATSIKTLDSPSIELGERDSASS